MTQLEEKPIKPVKQTAISLINKKKKGEKISAISAYDYPSARVASESGIDMILVGDSLGMVLHGSKNTMKVTIDEVLYHTRLVSNAEPTSLVVTDMPFGSYHISIEKALENAIRCIKEGGAEAVKLEGGRRRFKIIDAIIKAEIPVLGHLGLTPQSVYQLGGFKTQGKLKAKAEEILEDAIELEKLGVFAIILESIPVDLAKTISESISIPTIGIGAGKYCDGQILVFHDMMGFTDFYLPKFVRKYADIYPIMRDALNSYIKDIQSGNFPGDNESYHAKSSEQEK
jgi:3-methyl-2-oxobutanoate hydroxymethyltransferase